MTIKDYSSTAASNTSINGVSIAGTAPVSNMDDGLRNVMADISNWTDADAVTAASTTDLGSVAGMYVTVSGTATITSFGTLKAGMVKFVLFSGAGQITYNATSLILPGTANITRASGDIGIFVSTGSGNWRCLSYQRVGLAPHFEATSLTWTANQIFDTSGQAITLKSQNASAGPAFIRLQDSASTNIGFIGLGSAADDRVAIQRNTSGRITIDATSTGTIDLASATTVTSSFQVGSYSGTGASTGKLISNSGVISNLVSSAAQSAAATHQQFINTNGAVGSITTSGTATAFNTTSDETFKAFIGEYDPQNAIAIIRADPVRDFNWTGSGEYAVGWGAQTSYGVSADLATPGGWKDPYTGLDWSFGEPRVRWIDPETEQPWEEGAKRWVHPVTREPWVEGGEGWFDRYGVPIPEEDLNTHPEPMRMFAEEIAAYRIDAVYHPWGVDQSKRTPYLWAALSWALDQIDDLKARVTALEA